MLQKVCQGKKYYSLFGSFVSYEENEVVNEVTDLRNVHVFVDVPGGLPPGDP